jgi:FkbM family methyltransferase
MTSHEDRIIDLFNPLAGETIVDVGAHIGNYTLIGAKRIGPRGKAISIEADPDNFYILKKNIKLNHFENVSLLNCAVYSEKSQIKLYTFKDQSEFSIYNTLIATRATPRKYILVQSETLDNILKKKGIDLTKISWIKIDVEGAELEVLKGATDTLTKSRNISLLIEVHNISDGISLYQPVKQFLKMHGFRITFEKPYLAGEKHIIARRHS